MLTSTTAYLNSQLTQQMHVHTSLLHALPLDLCLMSSYVTMHPAKPTHAGIFGHIKSVFPFQG